MKGPLHFINNDHGFVLPYVLFIAAFILIVLSANIQTYEHDIYMTEQHLEQLRIESILQMGHISLKNDLINDNDLKSASYSFPYGELDVEIVRLDQNTFHVFKNVITKNKSKYKLTKHITLHEN